MATRGQIAFEYIVIVGLVLFFLIPLWAYVTTVKEGTIEQLSLSYAENAVSKVTSNADLVYSQGIPAKVTISVYIPSGVSSYNITNTTVTLTVWSSGSLTDVSSVSIAPMQGSLPISEGKYKISIESMGSYVNLTVL